MERYTDEDAEKVVVFLHRVMMDALDFIYKYREIKKASGMDHTDKRYVAMSTIGKILSSRCGFAAFWYADNEEAVQDIEEERKESKELAPGWPLKYK